MNSYRAIISYDGTDFAGWQIQPQQRTIQGALLQGLRAITKKQEGIRTMGAGRTDAGVHAKNQVARVDLPVSMPPCGLHQALQKRLPRAIQVKSIELMDRPFHPIKNALSKTYHYYFSHDSTLPPSLSRYITVISSSPSLEKMNRACALFLGRKSFHNFFCSGTPIKGHFVRTIEVCKVDKTVARDPFGGRDFPVYCLSITGQGFLKQMVRLMAGAIIISGDESLINMALQQHPRANLRPFVVMPPQGLFLDHVRYPF